MDKARRFDLTALLQYFSVVDLLVCLKKCFEYTFCKHRFSIFDEALEDAIYDSYAFQECGAQYPRIESEGVDFCESTAPDATTLLKFRYFTENKKAGEQIFEKINEILDQNGKIMHGISIVDALIIDALSSTKNKKARARPRNEIDEKRRRVPLWHESACWS